jgi:transposase-like protein
MQNRDIRAAILTLHKQGLGLRAIARTVKVQRNTVRRVLGSGSVEVPALERAEKAEPYEARIRELFERRFRDRWHR